jgi:hypothetical protein
VGSEGRGANVGIVTPGGNGIENEVGGNGERHGRPGVKELGALEERRVDMPIAATMPATRTTLTATTAHH